MTAAPMKVYANVRVTPGGATVDPELKLITVVNSVRGIKVYDGLGGVTPVPRTLANTEAIDSPIAVATTAAVDASVAPVI